MSEVRSHPLRQAGVTPPPGENHSADAGSLSEVWRSLWEAPDPVLSHAGASGELLVAKIRAVLAVFILYIPLSYLVVQPARLTVRVALALVGVALLQTLVVYRVLRRHRQRQWLGFVSSLLDVTLVSAALVSPLVLEPVVAATRLAPGSRSAFLIYLLAIFATALRYDARICLVTGAAAVLQYGLIAAVAAGLGGVERVSGAAGWMAVVEETGRLILLAAAAMLAAAIVVRSRGLRRLSTRDPLTGVLTRGFFHERLETEAARLERSREPTACAMLDLDHFKRFNDSHGHQVGDDALRVMGGILRASFRASDVVARYGGEEFAVVVPGLGPRQAMARMEAVRRAVARATVPVGEGRTADLTVSIGVACFPEEAESIENALRLADRRLYEAKASGRARVVGPEAPRPRGVPAAG